MRRTIFSLLLSLLAFGVSATVQANTDDQFSQLLKKRDFGQVDRQARERIRANPNDEQAYNFVALAALQGDATMREDAMSVIKSCTEKLPKSSRCHHRLGQLYGVAAMSGGMMAAMKYGGQIKDLISKAVENDPTNFEARRDLIQFYLQAPGMVGGSVSKAQEQATAHAKVNAQQAKVLDLDIHIYRKEWDPAEKLVTSLTGADEASRNAVRSATANLGFALINANQLPRAQKVFETGVKQQPEVAVFHFGLGRTLLESKQVDAAIAALEKATELDPAVGAQYRLGIAYQLKGDKTRAIANLERFLDVKPPRTGKAADDARQRLEQLKRSA
jgi:tetratricopeptide (TPR) repeat protein